MRRGPLFEAGFPKATPPFSPVTGRRGRGRGTLRECMIFYEVSLSVRGHVRTNFVEEPVAATYNDVDANAADPVRVVVSSNVSSVSAWSPDEGRGMSIDEDRIFLASQEVGKCGIW